MKFKWSLLGGGAGNPDNTDWYREHAGAFSEALEHVAADLPNIMEVYTRSPEVVLLRIEEEMYQVEHS